VRIFSTSTAIAFVAVCGAWFGHPNPMLHLPPAVLLFPVGLCYLATRASRARQAFTLGWITGSLAFAACLYWVALPVHNFGLVPWILAAPCPMLLAMVLGLFTGLFTLGLHLTEGRLPWPLQALYAGALWGALELFRGWLFTGFPWLALASAFSFWPSWIQATSLIGSLGLGAFMVIAAWLAARFLAPDGPHALSLILGAALLALPPVHGAYVLSRPLSPVDSVTAGVVQGNIDQAVKWDQAFVENTIQQYSSLTAELVAKHKETPLSLVVWPETAMPFFMQEDRAETRQVRRLVRDLRTPLLNGAPAYIKHADKKGHNLYNRAFFFDGSGRPAGHYDKEHLVPFGEYVPFAEYFPFVDKLVHGIGDFRKGSNDAPLHDGRLALGVLICYEAIFPELAQERVAQGANLLVNISNDAWYGRSSAAAQHLSLALLRAVEQQRSLVRATNTGISALSTARGEIIANIGLFETSAVAAPVGLHSEKSMYHHLYNVINYLLTGLALTLLLLGRAISQRGRTKSQHTTS
jgi:apolipoprotein N-acyltransferase